jgi:hypothetical protein
MLDLRSMFCNFDPHPGHIEYLPLLMIVRFYFLQDSMAGTAFPDSMNLNVVRTLHGFQGIPAVSWLPAAFLLVPFAKALGGWLLVSITGGRFAAVVAIPGQLIFQHLDPFHEVGQRFGYSLEEQDNSLFSFPVGGAHFCFCG